MNVTNLPVDTGPAGWNAILPPAPGYPVLDQTVNADFAIVGAGFTGIAAARRLRQLHPQATIVLIDACSIADGPAGRNSGFMIDTPHDLSSSNYSGDLSADHYQIALNRSGIAFAGEACDEYELADDTLVMAGKINAAVTARGVTHNARYARHLTLLNEIHTVFDAAEMQRITGTDYYQQGLHTPGAALLQPAQYVRGTIEGLQNCGVSVYTQSPVTAFTKTDNVWQLSTPKGTVCTPCVLLAVNGHAQSFGYYQRRFIHVFTYASMSRALTPKEIQALGGQDHWALTPADPLGTTVRKICGTGGHRIIIRNRATINSSMRVGQSTIDQIAKTHDQSFRNRFPMLPDVTMEYRWGGRLCLSRNGATAFGKLDDGLYSACCQNGLGTAKGTAHGKLIAEFACGETSDLLEMTLAQDPPVRLPSAPFVHVGATAKIRWGEWLAGAEL